MVFDKISRLESIPLNYLGYGKVAVMASSDIEKIAATTACCYEFVVSWLILQAFKIQHNLIF